jgi:hypothetical protein
MRFALHKLMTIAVLGTVTVISVGCGSNVQQEGQQLQARSLLASSPPLARAVVSDRDIAKYPAGSVQRAFFSYWQDLQFQSWRSGASSYDPALQRFIGPQQLIESLEALASYYRTVKPLLYSVKQTSFGTTLVRYIGSPTGGPVALQTVEWRHIGNAWQIESDSLLNLGLTSSAQEVEQTQLDPTAQKPSIQAVRAGETAGHLQAAYLSLLIAKALVVHRGSPRSSR